MTQGGAWFKARSPETQQEIFLFLQNSGIMLDGLEHPVLTPRVLFMYLYAQVKLR